MIAAGCDVGSLTAKAVVLRDGACAAVRVMPVRPLPAESAERVLLDALAGAGLTMGDLDVCCSTGYGRLAIPFADMNRSEIACHGRGAFHVNPRIRTVIDIGGQDCKVIRIDGQGRVLDFAMNDKCAAGTGRSLEMLAEALGLDLEGLARLAAGARRCVRVTDRCSIFMELEVLEHRVRGVRLGRLACGVADAVARRVATLARSVDLEPMLCLCGGVARNAGVKKRLQMHLGARLATLPFDPQAVGALGAALIAAEAARRRTGTGGSW